MISVCMSVYNCEKYLEESIKSILEQTFRNFEFLIVDDCSTDNSLKIIKKYSQIDNRIKFFVNKKRMGLTKNLNFLIEKSEKKYIARMDADDISKQNRFEEQIKVFNNFNVDIVGTFCADIGLKNEIIRKRTLPIEHNDIVKMLPKLCPIAHPSVMFNKEKIQQIGSYNEYYKTSQDYSLWFKAASHNLIFYNIPKILLHYRIENSFKVRRKIQFRLLDFKIRLEGYKLNNYPKRYYFFLFIPLCLAIMPFSLYNLLKKIDPR